MPALNGTRKLNYDNYLANMLRGLLWEVSITEIGIYIDSIAKIFNMFIHVPYNLK